ncbi:hypothetical protein B0H11DRAFT_2197033 [Mycena galericulata]|nr:hypothetical protein B0H11DRAFT_2197033 [Mycena galericulata]
MLPGHEEPTVVREPGQEEPTRATQTGQNADIWNDPVDRAEHGFMLYAIYLDASTTHSRFRSLRKRLTSCTQTQTPFHKVVKLIGTDINIETLHRRFPRAILGHDSSTDEWIVKFMPSGAYGIAANLLVTEIVDRYREENNTSMSAVCYPSGTRNKTHEDPVFRLTPTRSKQADQSFCSVQRSVESPPVAVVEAGESRTQLVDDACWWLQSGGVNLVILIILGPQTLTVEMWVRTTAAGDLGSFASLRGSPLVYPRLVLGDNSLVLPLSIRYADLGIQTTNNLKNNTLVVPMDRWANGGPQLCGRTWDEDIPRSLLFTAICRSNGTRSILMKKSKFDVPAFEAHFSLNSGRIELIQSTFNRD